MYVCSLLLSELLLYLFIFFTLKINIKEKKEVSELPGRKVSSLTKESESVIKTSGTTFSRNSRREEFVQARNFISSQSVGSSIRAVEKQI